jgi:hypothetical protein
LILTGLFVFSLQNKDATSCNPTQTQATKQALLQTLLEEEGVRGVHSNN